MRWPARLRHRVAAGAPGPARLRAGLGRLGAAPGRLRAGPGRVSGGLGRLSRSPRRRAVAVLALGLVGVPTWLALGTPTPSFVLGAAALITVAQVLLWRANRRILADLRGLLARGTGAIDRVEATQRRILAAVEADRLAAADRQRPLGGLTGLARRVSEPVRPARARPPADLPARAGLPQARAVETGKRVVETEK